MESGRKYIDNDIIERRKEMFKDIQKFSMRLASCLYESWSCAKNVRKQLKLYSLKKILQTI